MRRSVGLSSYSDRRQRHPRAAARQRRLRGVVALGVFGLLLLLTLQAPSPPPQPSGDVAIVLTDLAQLSGPALPPPVDFTLPMEPPPPLAAELQAPAATAVVLPDLRGREMGIEALDLAGGFVSIAPGAIAGSAAVPDPDMAREMVEARAAEREPPAPPLAAPRRERGMAASIPPAVPATPGVASVAIIIDDVGPAHGWSARAMALPGPLTMSFLPYAEALPEQIGEARRRGHEIFLHMPMQPLGDANPGRNALRAGMSAADIRDRLGWAIDRVGQPVGMNNHMGSRMTEDPAAMRVVMDVLRQRGLMFVDSRTSPRSVAAGIAAEEGLPHTGRDVFLDHFPGPDFVRRQLAELEGRARRTGTAVAIGHPLPTTIGVLAEWIPAAKKRGLRFVKASEAIAARGCDGKSVSGRCGLLHTAGGRQPAEGG